MAKSSCESCKFWDQDAFVYDLAEEHDDVPDNLGDWGYCRKFPPAPGLSDHLYDPWPTTRTKDWCGQYDGMLSGLKGFLDKHPDLTPVDPDEDEGDYIDNEE